MRITIENTEEQGSLNSDRRRVVFETNSNDLDVMTIIQELRGLLIAYGYHNENIDEYLLTCYNNYQENSRDSLEETINDSVERSSQW